MKYKSGISEHKFMVLSEEKQKNLLFLLLKEIERSEGDTLEYLKEDLIRLLLLTDLSNLSEKVKALNTRQDIINLIFPYFSEEFYNEKDFHFKSGFEIKTQDNDANKEKFPLILVLHNLRSAFNVGSIIRSAECFGIEKLIFSGYTPKPDHPKVKQTSMGTSEKIKWEFTEDIFVCLDKYRQDAYGIYALETANPSFKLNNYSFAEQSVVVLGNEALGVENEVLNKVDAVIEIPLFGWKNSLNVGTATAICCYEITNQMKANMINHG